MPSSLIVDRVQFAAVLAKVAPVASRKTTVPVTENVRLEAASGVCRVQATDLDVTMSAQCPCDPASDLLVLVPAAKTLEIVRSLTSLDVTLSLNPENRRVTIHAGRATFVIGSVSADDWPNLPAPAGTAVQVDGVALRELVEHTAYAQSSDETRYVLNGIHLEAQDGSITAVSTDGHRLSLSSRPVPGAEALLPVPTILPRRGVEMLRRLVDGDAEPVAVTLEKSHATFSRADQTLSMRLVEGRYPDYRQVVPKEAQIAVALPADELAAALRRVALVAEGRSGTVLRLRKGTLELSTANAEVGDASEELGVEYSGEDFKIGVNGAYLSEAVRRLAADQVVLGFGDELSPMTVRPVAGASGDVAVVMPMRV